MSKAAPTSPFTLQSIDDLKPASYNPRTIAPKAQSGLNKSLCDFGDISGITWNARTGNLVCGHQRVEQLRKLGAVWHKGALCVGADGPRFNVRVVDWDLSKEKAANIVANNAYIAGDFTDALNGLLAEIKCSEGDASFTQLRLDELILMNKRNGSTDSDDEWIGMPEFNQDDAMPYRTIKVHFDNDDDAKEFGRAIAQNVTNKTKSLHFPKQINADLKSMSYESET